MSVASTFLDPAYNVNNFHRPTYYPFILDDLPKNVQNARADELAQLTRKQFHATARLQMSVVFQDMCRSQAMVTLQEGCLRRVEQLIRTLKNQRDAESGGGSPTTVSQSGYLDKGKGKRAREDQH
jgi:hypothetical protein